MEYVLEIAGKYPVASVSSLTFYLFMLAACIPALRRHIVPRFAHPISPKQSFLSSMDALRGFAALYVAVGHSWHWTYPVFYKAQHTVPSLAYAAKAVPMFAVLSGFLIYRSVRNIATLEDIRYYIARRAFRIYPLYFLSILICLISGQIATEYEGIGPLSYIVSEIMMFRALDFPLYANPVTWSLYVELIFYAFLPLFVIVFGVPRIVKASLAMLVMLMIADQVPSREFYLWKYFFFGIIASELSLQYEKELKGSLGNWILVVGLVLFIADLGGPKYDWVANSGIVKRNLAEYTVALGLSFAMIAAAVPYVDVAARILNLFLFRFIGVVSYSVFIVHPFYLMTNFPELVLRKVGTQTEYFKTLEAMPDWYLPFVFVPGIFAWAAVTFLLIERPALIAGSRLIASVRNRRPSERAAPTASAVPAE